MIPQGLTFQQVFTLASEKLAGGDLIAAEELFRATLQAQPGNTDLMTYLASVLFTLGRRKEAFAIITQAVEHNVSSARPHAQRDRMLYVERRAADPATKIELEGMHAVLSRMDAELATNEIYVPSKFWTKQADLHKHLLAIYGIDQLKRTVAHSYQNWMMRTFDDPQAKRLLELWPEHMSSQPFYNGIEKPDDVGFHHEIHVPFYDLADPLQCDVYRLAVGLLFEHTLVHDESGLLEGLEESLIGNPLRIHRKGKLISSDICHSLRERNQILRTTNLSGSEQLVVGELGAGNGRLAEIFGRTTNYRYVIFDITPALYVSQWYIKKLFPNEKVFEFRHFDNFSEIEDELRHSRFAFFTANQIEFFPPESLDIFINVNSLVEMERRQITNFLRKIGQITKAYFFSQQWFKWYNDFDKITLSTQDFKLGDGWESLFAGSNAVFPHFFVQIWKRIKSGSVLTG